MQNSLDLEALENAYQLGLEYEKNGKLQEAAQAYAKVLKIDPQDHTGVSIRLASIGKGQIPEKAPTAYVTTLFDQIAEAFDYILVDQLHYEVPFVLREIFDKEFPKKSFSHMLDLGCGTGLAAEAFEDLVKKKTGIDLAKNMIEIADEKGDYDKLFIGDALDFLKNSTQTWDLILATDVFPYIGDITEFIDYVAKHMAYKGVFCFSTEKLCADNIEGQDQKIEYNVGKHQRFAHREEYLCKTLERNRLKPLLYRDITIRLEQNMPVLGQLYITEKY